MLVFYTYFLALVWGLFFPADKNADIEYARYLPDFKSHIVYPKNSKLVTFTPAPGKKVIYVAPIHSNDQNSVARRKIKELIADAKPDLCIIEGVKTREGLSPARIIEISGYLMEEEKGGENTWAAYWCNHYNIPFIGGHVDDAIMYEGLLKKGYSQEDIVFYQLLNIIPWWDKDRVLAVDNPKEQFETFLNKTVAGWFNLDLRYTYEDFLGWYKKQFAREYNPKTDFLWTFPFVSWTDLNEGAYIFQKIGADSYLLIDNNVIQTIRESIKKYNTVLVVYGATTQGNHYIWQKKALETFLGPATEIDLVD